MPTKEVVPVNRITQALAEQNVTEQVLAGLKKHLALKVTSPEDKKGYALVHEARMQCRDLRVLATKIAKAGREDAVKEQKAWIAEEKRVVGQIEEVESYLEAQERIVDEAKEKAEKEAAKKIEKEKLEAEARKRERVEKRVNALTAVGVFRSFQELDEMIDSDFDILLKKSTETHEAALKQKAEDDEKRRIEQKRLDDQKAEQDRVAAAQRAEQKKLDDAKRLQELEDAKKKAAEDARVAAEQKAKREAEEKAEKERLAKIEADRIAALAPDKEKLKKFADALDKLPVPEMKTADGKKILAEATALIEEAITHLNK